MPEIVIEPAGSRRESDSALALAWETFRARTPAVEGRSYKEVLWYEDPNHAVDNVIVARRNDGAVVGVTRIVPRVIWRGEQSFTVAGISSVCVHEQHRGTGLSDRLIRSTLEIATERGYELSFLFARKAVDRYYLRYGFHGLAAYSTLSVEVPSTDMVKSAAMLRPANWSDSAAYSRAHECSYRHCFGSTRRTEEYWQYIHSRIGQMSGVSMLDIEIAGRVKGYVIVGTGIVHEIALEDDCDSEAAYSVVAAVGAMLNKNSGTRERVYFEMAPQHSFLPLLTGLDTTCSLRECSYGGHMGRILAPESILEKLSARIGKRLSDLDVGGLNFERGRLTLRWDGDDCVCRLDTLDPMLSGRETYMLLGASSNTGGDFPFDPALPLNISLMDQF